MSNRLSFWLNRLGERLWVRPLVFCILSVGGAFLAKIADRLVIGDVVPDISPDSIETLLSIVASSMLVIATFAVASMVSAYASAGSVGTPRSFPLIVSDDVSKNALSVFIGAFIFSIVALVALKNSYYQNAGHFALFVLTLGVFAWVVLTFVRWVDRIARLGRLGTTVDKVESAASGALQARRRSPSMGAVALTNSTPAGRPVFASKIGYVQHIDVGALQRCAEKWSLQVAVATLPGTLITPDKPIVYVFDEESDADEFDESVLVAPFQIGDDRVYEGDPRFGLIALSEIASRALSPAVNDPGTAIDVIGTLIRLFAAWSAPLDDDESSKEIRFDRVHVPLLSVRDLFDDTFASIARDGAGLVEVQIRLQKALRALAAMGDDEMALAATEISRLAFERAKTTLTLQHDIDLVTAQAEWSAEQC